MLVLLEPARALFQCARFVIPGSSRIENRFIVDFKDSGQVATLGSPYADSHGKFPLSIDSFSIRPPLSLIKLIPLITSIEIFNMNLDFEQLATFERIVREGSFSAAAWAMDIPQPTVSARIKALEATL